MCIADMDLLIQRRFDAYIRLVEVKKGKFWDCAVLRSIILSIALCFFVS